MKLTVKDRKAMPKADFALPKEKAYPIENKAHARNALARVSEFGSPAEKSEVKAKVKEKFPSIDAKKPKGMNDDHAFGHPKNHAEFEKLGK